MDKEKFIKSLLMPILRAQAYFCLEKTDWIDYEDLLKVGIDEYKKTHKKSKTGAENKSKKGIAFLVKIGFLIADPKKGLMVNKEFIPLSQQ